MPEPPALDTLALADRQSQHPSRRSRGFTFQGYRNPDRVRRHPQHPGHQAPSVQCVAGTMDHAVKRIREELLPRYPNVDDVVAVTHGYGCGVAISAPEAHSADPHPAEHRPATPTSAGR